MRDYGDALGCQKPLQKPALITTELRGVTGAGPRAADGRATGLPGWHTDGAAIRGRRRGEPSGCGTDIRLSDAEPVGLVPRRGLGGSVMA